MAVWLAIAQIAEYKAETYKNVVYANMIVISIQVYVWKDYLLSGI